MNLLHQFDIKVLAPFVVAGWDLSLSNSALVMLLSSLTMIVFLTVGLWRREIIPSGIQSIAERFLEMVIGILDDAAGRKARPFFPLILAIFSFILMGNLWGMVPYSFTFTSQLIVNFALGVGIVLCITVVGIVRHGWLFVRVFAPRGVPLWLLPILVPVEVISYLSRAISLAIRLMANMIAGHSMLKIFAYFTISAGAFGFIPLSVNVVLTAFELLVAGLQAYVFAMLSCIYLRDALESH